MGLYESDYESASADLGEYYGQPISYTDDVRTAAEISQALVHPEKSERRKNEYGWYWQSVRVVKFADPGWTVYENATVTIDGTAYTVERIGKIPGNRIQLDLIRVEMGEVGRGNYRR